MIYMLHCVMIQCNLEYFISKKLLIDVAFQKASEINIKTGSKGRKENAAASKVVDKTCIMYPVNIYIMLLKHVHAKTGDNDSFSVFPYLFVYQWFWLSVYFPLYLFISSVSLFLSLSYPLSFSLLTLSLSLSLSICLSIFIYKYLLLYSLFY